VSLSKTVVQVALRLSYDVEVAWCVDVVSSAFYCYAPAPVAGALSDDTRLTSVAYIGPKSRTARKSKIGTKVAHVTRDSGTTFKVKRSKVNLQEAGIYCGGLPHSLFLYQFLLIILESFHNSVMTISWNGKQARVSWPVQDTGNAVWVNGGCVDGVPPWLGQRSSINFISCEFISIFMHSKSIRNDSKCCYLSFHHFISTTLRGIGVPRIRIRTTTCKMILDDKDFLEDYVVNTNLELTQLKKHRYLSK